MQAAFSRGLLGLFLSATVAACAGTSEATADSQDNIDSARHRVHDAGARDAALTDAAKPDAAKPDAGAPDAQPDAAGDAAAGDDGTPTRVACTSAFGSGLAPGGFGRLDGVIVSVVSPGGGSCNADAHHVHVQVSAGGQTYDIAVNVGGGFFAEKDVALPGAAWSEGWHAPASLDYVADLGLHSTDFTTGTLATITQEFEAALASANHVSVFATTYGPGGAHLVHRQGQNTDGALITDPLSPSAHLYAFHFSTQSF